MTADKPAGSGPGAGAGAAPPAIRLTAGWVAEAMGGDLVSGDRRRELAGVSIDTRTIGAGELYFAIRGDRFDGTDFAAAALAAGAGGVVVPSGRGRDVIREGAAGPDDRSGAPLVIEVAETTSALQALAHTVRRASGTTVVAITGSAGKTTTKEVTAEFLETRYRVIRNRGNFNNHIGLPLSLIDLRQRPEIAVVELGMNHAGEISTLVRIAEPDVRVWTNVGDAHLEFFGSLDDTADAKAEILEGAADSALLVANADDDRIMARAPAFAGRLVTFGIERPAAVRASAIVDRGVAGTSARITTPRGAFDLTTPLVGPGNLANVLAATAVAAELDVPLEAIAERAQRLGPAARRGEIVRLSDGVTIIDDSYNANPTATRQALHVLAHERTAVRRVAVLGEMLELGDRATALHEAVGRAAAALRIDLLVTVGGGPAAALAAAAIAAGVAAGSVRHFATSDEAAAAVVDLVRAGDLLLVKGSRGVRTDRVVERLKAERA
ncbi:MAG: UDP-N-acetylmuramoyl-tripeptide--D-alanyl-D-alanine ligase [Acidobacteriota bacterium]